MKFSQPLSPNPLYVLTTANNSWNWYQNQRFFTISDADMHYNERIFIITQNTSACLFFITSDHFYDDPTTNLQTNKGVYATLPIDTPKPCEDLSMEEIGIFVSTDTTTIAYAR